MSEPITVEAVYENGVLRPTSKLPLSEGQKVVVVVRASEPVAPASELLAREPRLLVSHELRPGGLDAGPLG